MQPLAQEEHALRLAEQLGRLLHALELRGAADEPVVGRSELRPDPADRLTERIDVLVVPKHLRLKRVDRLHIGEKLRVPLGHTLRELLVGVLQPGRELAQTRVNLVTVQRAAHVGGRVECRLEEHGERRIAEPALHCERAQSPNLFTSSGAIACRPRAPSMASPSRRRVLDPLPFLDMEAVLASGAAESVREQHIRASWRRIVREGVEDLESLSECLPPEARSALRRTHAVTTSKVVSAVPTSAQKGFKLVIALQDGKLVETVAIVHEGVSRSTGTLQGRVTVCVSSQVGCKMGCTFCATGTLGWIGDLSAGEIVEQVWHVERRAPDFGVHWRVTNVTFMGMGGADGALNPP